MKTTTITRRKSIEKILEIAALAGGMSLAEFKDVMAQSYDDLGKLHDVKALYKEAKLLKDLLIPDREIFESEFGRKPIQNIFLDRVNGIIQCTVNEDLLQSVYGHKDCPSLESCGTNTCGGQNCGKLSSCGDNICSGQSRIQGFDSNLVDLTSTGTLDRIKSDPFVQALYREMNVKSSNTLRSSLQSQINLNIQSANKIKTDPRVGKCAKVKAVDPQAKLLKVTLMPTAEVFRQEFGDWPKGFMELNPDTGLGDCIAHLNSFGDFVIIDQGSCTENGCQGQSCSTLSSCGKNGCNNQSCDGLSSCDDNGPLLDHSAIDRIKNDPFVSALFREFGTSSSTTLSNELKSVLGVGTFQLEPNRKLQSNPQLQQQ